MGLAQRFADWKWQVLEESIGLGHFPEPTSRRSVSQWLADTKWEQTEAHLDSDFTFSAADTIVDAVSDSASEYLSGRSLAHTATAFTIAGVLGIGALAGCSPGLQNTQEFPSNGAASDVAGEGEGEGEQPIGGEGEGEFPVGEGEAPTEGEGEGERAEGEGEGEIDSREVNAYTDSDKDGYGAAGTDPITVVLEDGQELPDNLSLNDYDCEDGNPDINPDALAELCNDDDMDCNGNPYTFGVEGEDNFTNFDVGAECYTGIGACEVPGSLICDPNNDEDTGVICYTNAPGQPSAELCDGVDNDCDGNVDEEIDPRLYDLQDGVCLGAVETCDPNGTGEWQRGDINLYEAGNEVSCDGYDNDCDGVVDDNITRAYDNENGVCLGAVEVCNNGEWQLQEPDNYGSEVCDGLDNDCDGVVDGMQRAYDNDNGVCLGAIEICNGGEWQLQEPAGYGNELCDGVDNDCDGVVDGMQRAYDNDNGVCLGAVEVCNNGEWNLVQPDNYGPEICDGLDNDCDGRVDVSAAGVDTRLYCAEDRDGDGFANNDALRGFCAEVCPVDPVDGIQYRAQGGEHDFNDNPATGGALMFPGAVELCDTYDNDGDGNVDNVLPANLGFLDNREGVCLDARNLCVNGEQTQEGAYSGENIPDFEGIERSCDGLDNDCDGLVDYGGNGRPLGIPTMPDGDGDGVYAGVLPGFVDGQVDLNNLGDLVYECEVSEGRVAVDVGNFGEPDCNDGNRDLQYDKDSGIDFDGDDYASGVLGVNCSPAEGYLEGHAGQNGDCNDDPLGADGVPDTPDDGRNIHPGAVETSDLLDNDCDSIIDNADFAYIHAGILNPELGENDDIVYTSNMGEVQKQVTMGRYSQGMGEIPISLYNQAVDAGLVPELPNGGGGNPDLPVTGITLAQARAFCDWAYSVDIDGDGINDVIGDVPTWAQSGYAATSGVKDYPGGNEEPGCESANYRGLNGGSQFCIGNPVDARNYNYGNPDFLNEDGDMISGQVGNVFNFALGDPVEQLEDGLPIHNDDIAQSAEEAMYTGGAWFSAAANIKGESWDSFGIDETSPVVGTNCNLNYTAPAENNDS